VLSGRLRSTHGSGSRGVILVRQAILSVIVSDPNGTQPANVALMSVLVAWCAIFAVRGRRAQRCWSLAKGDGQRSRVEKVLAVAADRPLRCRYTADTVDVAADPGAAESLGCAYA
jgi:hypothetical protein